MAKYGADAKEEAYQLFMVQQLPFLSVIEAMRKSYPTFSKGTLTKWKNDKKLDWEGRYQDYCTALARRNDTQLAKTAQPILDSLRVTRQKVYERIKTVFDDELDVISDKSIGQVMSSFVRMCELEYKMTGGKQDQAPTVQLIQVIINVLEKDPNVGPVIKVHKGNIVDAIFEEIKDSK